MHIFRNIYSWLSGMYGQQLYSYFKGVDCNGFAQGADQFVVIGWIVIAIAAVTAALFYFIPRARFNLLGAWLISLLIVVAMGWGFGYIYSMQKYNSGAMPDYVVYGIDNVVNPNEVNEYGEQEDCSCDQLVHVDGAQPIVRGSEFVGFGFVNAIYVGVLFIVFSLIFKNFSVGSRRTPF